MTIVPETRSGKILFYETHLPVWAADPASIGVTPAAVAALGDLVAEARAARAAQRRAQDEARAATARYHEAVRRMHAASNGGAALIQTIKAFAQTSGDDGVYPRASLPVPASPGRPGSAPAPGTPRGFAVTLRQTGAIELTWKCDNPGGTAGTIYQVKRQLGDGIDGEPFTTVGTVGAKSFVDRTLPPGTRLCTYEVTALRSTAKGEPARYTIRLGADPGAARVAPVQVKGRRLVA
jgi:hypothetical protein